MKFCKCGKLMKPKGQGVWYCPACGHEETDTSSAKMESNKKKQDDVTVIDSEGVSGFPTTEVKCPECGNDKAYYQVLQTRSSDEPPTRFYRCTKCGKKWREYS